tara:strand:+ start:55 stop:303 length:249 start_codon:yes stop_codon:yes gene_type:complete
MFLFHKKKTGRKKEEDKKEEIIINKYSFINKSNNLDECVICLEKMRESENLTILKCSHIYHSECIEKWLKKKSICPMCDTII